MRSSTPTKQRQTNQFAQLLIPHLDAKIVNKFLAQFACTLPADEQAVMIWDGAGFHVAKERCVPENVKLVKLPPTVPASIQSKTSGIT